MNFRRHLKNWRKEINRHIKDAPSPFVNLRAILNAIGIEITCISDFDAVMRCTKAKGRHFTRLGRAARKQGLLVFLRDISDYAEHEADLREVPFYSVEVCRTIMNYGGVTIAENCRTIERNISGIPFYPLKKNESSKTPETQIAAV